MDEVPNTVLAPARRMTIACYECGKPVDVPQAGWQSGQPAYCSKHWVLVGEDPHFAIKAGAMLALDEVRMNSTEFIRWPFDAVHELCGFIRPKRVHYIAAFAGCGKTTFLAACLKHWVLREQKRVCYLPLEASREEAVARIAAELQGLPLDDIQSGFLQERAEQGDTLAAEQLERYELQLEELMHEDHVLAQHLWIHSMDSISVDNVEKLTQQLRARGVDILLVDHVDHQDSESANEFRTSTFVQHRMLQIAKQLGIAVILATQLNSKATGGNRIAKAQLAQMEWLWMKGVKEQIGAVVLCLYRPQKPGLDKKELEAARRGEVDWWTITEPHRMAVGAMKLRYLGRNNGKSAVLSFEQGELRDLNMTERFQREQALNSIRTSWEDA